MSKWKVNCYVTLAMALCLVGSAVAQNPEVAIDLDRDTPGIQTTLTVSPGGTVLGSVELVSYPGTGYTAYAIQIVSDPCEIGVASTTGGTMADMFIGGDAHILPCVFGRQYLPTSAQPPVGAPATMFTFDITVPDTPGFTGPLSLTFKTDSPQLGLFDPVNTYQFQDAEVTVPASPATVNVGPVGPTDTPTIPVVIPTDTPTIPLPTDTPTIPLPTDTPTETSFVPTSTPTESPFVPTPTPTEIPPTPTVPPEEFALVAVDCYNGIHPAGGLLLNLTCPEIDYWPFHSARDADLTVDQAGILVLGLDAHVDTYSIGETCVPQIPNESQFIWPGLDLAAAIATAPDGSGAYVLLDDGEILAIGAAPDTIPDVSPALPWRAGTVPATAEFPGPHLGPLPIGTIATTGGWDEASAIDFDLTGPDGAIVLARDGRLHHVGSAAGISFDQSHSIYFWPDLARRIEYMNVGGQDYYIVLDGLGGVHMGGPAASALRTSFNSRVLNGDLTYFGAVFEGRYVGIDAANDFIPILHSGDSEIGIIMLDGLGGIHKANVPYTVEPTAYLPGAAQGLNTMISLLKVDLVQ